MIRRLFIQLFLGSIILVSSDCSKSLYISRSGSSFITKNRNRVPSPINSNKVERFFDNWFAESNRMVLDDTNELDSLSLLGYKVYELFMSDSSYITEDYEYVIVPNKIKIATLSRSSLDSCYNSFWYMVSDYKEYSTFEINNFRPQIRNRKCLYYTKKYQKCFGGFSAKYGVKPYVLINSPLMHGGDRFIETSPFVDEIRFYSSSNIISVVYSYSTSDFESFYEYDNNNLKFLKHRYELAVD